MGVSLQPGAEHLHTAVQIHANRRRCESRALRNLRTGHTLYQPKRQRFSIGVGHRAKHGQDGQRLSPIFVRPGGVVFERHFVPPVLSQVIGRAIARDGGEPAAKRGGLAQAREPAERVDEHILNEIVHVAAMDAGQHDPVHHADVAVVEGRERTTIAGFRRFDERHRFVAGPHGRRTHGKVVGAQGHERQRIRFERHRAIPIGQDEPAAPGVNKTVESAAQQVRGRFEQDVLVDGLGQVRFESARQGTPAILFADVRTDGKSRHGGGRLAQGPDP